MSFHTCDSSWVPSHQGNSGWISKGCAKFSLSALPIFQALIQTAAVKNCGVSGPASGSLFPVGRLLHCVSLDGRQSTSHVEAQQRSRCSCPGSLSQGLGRLSWNVWNFNNKLSFSQPLSHICILSNAHTYIKHTSTLPCGDNSSLIHLPHPHYWAMVDLWPLSGLDTASQRSVTTDKRRV